MRRLFVDVDDTLVLWQGKGEHPFGIGAEDWKVNTQLMLLVRDVLNLTPTTVIVWSGGGKVYADLWAYRIFSPLRFGDMGVLDECYTKLVTGAKLINFPSEGDVVVDDQKLVTKGKHFFPHQIEEIRKELGFD